MGIFAQIFGWVFKKLTSSSQTERVNVTNITIGQTKPEIFQDRGENQDELLKDAIYEGCSSKSPCAVSTMKRNGNLVELDDKFVIIDLKKEGLDEKDLKPRSACLVTFFYRGSQIAFSGLIIRYDPEIKRLVIEIVPSGKVRRDYRVNVFLDDELIILIKAGPKIFTPKAIDLSYSGVLIEAPGIDLQIDEKIQVDMKMGEVSLSLNGEVRRKEENKYGIFFPEAPYSTGSNANRLIKIVKTIERNRIKIKE